MTGTTLIASVMPPQHPLSGAYAQAQQVAQFAMQTQFDNLQQQTALINQLGGMSGLQMTPESHPGHPRWGQIRDDIKHHPESITLQRIDDETNIEVQREMIECFGWDRYNKECNADILDHDDRWGTLKRRRTASSEPVVYLEVVNRSPEPDGTFRHYVLPVHPQLRPLPDPDDPKWATVHGLGDPRRVGFGEPQNMTALNAVASTFGMTGEQYEAMLGEES